MTIITKKTITINAIGTHNHGNCKPVFCITDGKIYASVADAANDNGVHSCNISMAVSGKTKTCNGKKFCLVSNMTDYAEEIAESVQSMYGKATAYDAEVIKQAKIKKANEEFEHRKAVCNELRLKLANEERLLKEAEQKAMYVM